MALRLALPRLSMRCLAMMVRLTASALLLWPILGCATSSSTAAPTNGGGSTPSPFSVGTAADIYAIQNTTTGSQIIELGADSFSAQSPVSTLTTSLSASSIATDNYGNIYLGGYTSTSAAEILVFAAGSSGNAAPIRTITVSTDYAPSCMALDSSGNLYTVDGDGFLNVYASTATSPTRTVTGAATLITYPTSVAVDASGNVFVASSATGGVAGGLPHISVFPAGATGNVAPTRYITTANVILGVATDAAGDVYATSDTSTSPYSGSILKFSTSASGAATPTATITGYNTGLYTAGSLRTDATGNIYTIVQNPNVSPVAYTLLTFPASANGNVIPADYTSSTALSNASPSIALR